MSATENVAPATNGNTTQESTVDKAAAVADNTKQEAVKSADTAAKETKKTNEKFIDRLRNIFSGNKNKK